MIAFSIYRSFTVPLGLILGLLVAAPRAKGDAMAPWAGATATAGANTQTGATASAEDSWSKRVEYTMSGLWGGPYVFSVPAYGNSSASAGGSSESLLQANAMADIRAPGSKEFFLDGGTSEASASWSNDSVHLAPPSSGSLPDMVRLQFSLTFTTLNSMGEYYLNNGQVTFQANDETIKFNIYPSNVSYQSGNFDSVVDGVYGSKIGSFHLDLPVDSTGTSAAFSLMLSATSLANARNSTPGHIDLKNTLALTGVTRTDGSSLDGYGISFASGLSLGGEQPVPEPSTVALWSAVVIGGVWLRRRS